MPMHKLGTCICKGRGGLDYLNSFVFELKLNYFQYISEVTNEKNGIYCHFNELRKDEFLIFIKKVFL